MIQQQRQNQQAARQAAMIQQHYSGQPMPPGMQNAMGMSPAQMQAMGRAPMARPVNVNLPQHLQQQQAQVAQQQAAQHMEQQAAQQAQVISIRIRGIFKVLMS